MALRDQAVAGYMEFPPVVRARVRDAVSAQLRSRFARLTRHQLEALADLPPESLTMRQPADMLVVTPCPQ